MRRSAVVVCLVVAAAVVAVALPAHAAAGDIDTTFGTAGSLQSPPTGFDAGGGLVQSDAKLVVTGVNRTTSRFFLARYLPDGQPDAGFGTGGTVETAIGTFASAASVAEQPDHKLVVAGSSSGPVVGGGFLALARYTVTGTLDPGFGQGGVVTTTIDNGSFANSVLVQPEGKIVVGAGSVVGGGASFAVVLRYDANGALDPGFGTGGMVKLATPSGAFAQAFDVKRQDDGRLVFIAGTGKVARVTSAGQLDPSFGVGGLASLPGGFSSSDLALQTDGRILVTAFTGLARLNPDGSADTCFGSTGFITMLGHESPAGLAVQADGKILVGARRSRGAGDPGVDLLRFTPTGQPDSSFGPAGAAPASSAVASPKEVLLQSGKPVLLGGAVAAAPFTPSSYVLTRHLPGDVGATPIPSCTSIFFAEGTVRPGFQEYLTIQNAATIGGSVVVSFQAADDGGAPLSVPDVTLALAPASRTTFNVNDHVHGRGILVANVSVKLTSTLAIGAERPVYFSADPGLGTVVDGGHDVVGARSPRTEFAFAEGTVRPGFQEYVTLQNPGSAPGTATLAFQAATDAGSPVALPDTTVALPASSRKTLDVNAYVRGRVGAGAALNLSVRVTSDVPIVAERPLYFSADPGLGVAVDGGHDVIGGTLGRQFAFAEGTVRAGFQEYLTVQNPSPSAGTARLIFQGADDSGATVAIPEVVVSVPATSRLTFDVNRHVRSVAGGSVNLSVLVSSTIPVLVERPLYFSADPGLGMVVDGGHDVIGAAGSATSFRFAEGTVRPGFQEYLTIQNTGDSPAAVTFEFQASNDGGGAISVPSAVVTVAARSRSTFDVNAHFRARGVLVANVSVKATADKPVLVERPVYFSADPGLGTTVDGGHDVIGES